MIDIHCHILPCVDDGASDMSQALDMASCAVKEGIICIIATPHFIEDSFGETTKQRIHDELAVFKKTLIENNINLEVYGGCEVFISPGVPDLVKQGVIFTLNGSRYLLIELPMGSIPIYTEEVFYELELQGITPILAHPERKREVIHRPEILLPYLEKGVLLQVNSGSLTGFYGEKVAKTAWRLLEKGMVHVIATDAHNTRSRAPMVRKAYDMVANRMGQVKAEILFSVNPERILLDQEVEYTSGKVKQISRIEMIFHHMRKMLPYR
jgi:protein-tyrosine phosphatase